MDEIRRHAWCCSLDGADDDGDLPDIMRRGSKQKSLKLVIPNDLLVRQQEPDAGSGRRFIDK
jgi:hypothetical protein